jgi:hypothetical protein
MSVGRSRFVVVLLGAVVSTGCTYQNIAYYAPPPGLTPGQAVSVLGSKDGKFFLQSSEYRLVWAIDGLPVEGSAFHWDKPLLITAGQPHRLSLAYGWGGVVGAVDVEFTGNPGSTVVVKAEDAEPDRLARMWLEDAATGRILGDKLPVQLSYAQSAPMPIISDTSVIPIQATRMRH